MLRDVSGEPNFPDHWVEHVIARISMSAGVVVVTEPPISTTSAGPPGIVHTL